MQGGGYYNERRMQGGYQRQQNFRHHQNRPYFQEQQQQQRGFNEQQLAPQQTRKQPQQFINEGDNQSPQKRTAVPRRTLDYYSSVVNYYYDLPQTHNSINPVLNLAPYGAAALDLLISNAYNKAPATSYATKYVHRCINKSRTPIQAVGFTPNTIRLMTAASTGEITLWKTQTFMYEVLYQLTGGLPITCFKWANSGNLFLMGQKDGQLKIFGNNFKILHAVPRAHRDSLKSIAIAPSDLKFVTCSHDQMIKSWDLLEVRQEGEIQGHGDRIQTVDWHPVKSMFASGSKDQLVKLWDPRVWNNVATLYGHQQGVTQVAWNQFNPDWLLSASSDNSLRLFDVRMHRSLEVYKGHGRDVISIAWHPQHAELFASGGDDGQILYWLTDYPTPQARIEDAHDKGVTGIAWHPVGHVLASGSIDCSIKVWSRQRPGDIWRDRNYRDQEIQQQQQQEIAEDLDNMKPEPVTPIGIPGLDAPVSDDFRGSRGTPMPPPPIQVAQEFVGNKRHRDRDRDRDRDGDFQHGHRRGFRRHGGNWRNRRHGY